MKRLLLSSALAASALTATSFFQAAPAQALSFDGQLVVFNSSDVDKSFTVDFVDNRIGGANNKVGDGPLSSRATFTITGTTNKQANFRIAVLNDSQLASRVTAIGFDVSAIINGNVTDGVGINESKNNGTRVLLPLPNSAEFKTAGFGDNFSNGLGKREVCYGVNPAQGGACDGGGGVDKGETGFFNAALVLNNNVNQFILYNFAVRYQGIAGSALGDSGSGRAIPTPALLPGLLGLAFGLLRKQQQQESVEQEA